MNAAVADPDRRQSGEPAVVRVAARAKLNLYLHVTGRRADGYHLLDSLIAFAEAHDRLEARPARRLSLRLSGPFAPALAKHKPRDNLVLRAARALAEHGGVAAGAELVLEKHLPVAAGLGGGSADAAAALRALDRLWNLRAAAEDLMALALPLGADVPVCLAGRPAFVGGIGEEIDAAPPLPAAALLLVNPGRPLSTPRVFAARRGEYSAPARFEDSAADAGDLARLLAARGNDLTDAAVSLAPRVGAVLDRLAAARGCLLSRMAGSGATCFGLFTDDEAAESAAATLAADEPGWWLKTTRLLEK